MTVGNTGPLSDVELVLDAHADLGEGPTWDLVAQQLLWVDITAGVVHRFDPATGKTGSIDVGQPVGAAVPTSSGRVALAVKDGFSILDLVTEGVTRVADVEVGVPETMMNDGKVDPAGRFWAGTKDIEGRRPLGSLYRFDANHTVVPVVSGVTISNGLGWSPDQRLMYYIDSPSHGIDVFDFEMEDGSVSGRRRLVDLPKEWGLPDGMTLDKEGFFWVAFWGGGAVRRIAPDGCVVSVVTLPVSQVTSCAFGGEDLLDLYVTTARSGLGSVQLREQPYAGGLFRFRPEVPGVAEHPFIG
ncbi:MAG: SMP-30/gluconolactonase/LRE family protein [Actinomycetota bacterium]|nr:SMP-30/gluconolactonase/LRE family protein [Actinomycetota bacterium]